jgi:hypothetical protein
MPIEYVIPIISEDHKNAKTNQKLIAIIIELKKSNENRLEV